MTVIGFSRVCLALFSLPVLCGLLGPDCRAAAAAEFDIISGFNGTRLGGIAFPSPSGATPDGIAFDFHIGGTDYTDADITTVSWALAPSGGLASLNLQALAGDDPCRTAEQDGPCENHTVHLSANTVSQGGTKCPDPATPFPFCSSVGSVLVPLQFVPLAPAYTCVGFEPPLDSGPVTVKKNRVLPFKAELLDENGFALTDQDLAAPPVLQVLYNSGIGEPPMDVTDDALPAGLGMNGNAFVFQGSKWRFNLKTRNYTAPGTYTATMLTGDGAEYGLAQTCTAQFVVQ